jgi:hypothetical protein
MPLTHRLEGVIKKLCKNIPGAFAAEAIKKRFMKKQLNKKLY